MTADQYVLWFILMAFAIALILGLGTLKMAGVLRRPQRDEASTVVRRHAREVEHHHWYDRFHHAA
jgi:hypothetical protein